MIYKIEMTRSLLVKSVIYMMKAIDTPLFYAKTWPTRGHGQTLGNEEKSAGRQTGDERSDHNPAQ